MKKNEFRNFVGIDVSKLTLDAAGEVTTTYNLEGTVKTGIKVGASNKAEFVGNTDITVAYN